MNKWLRDGFVGLLALGATFLPFQVPASPIFNQTYKVSSGKTEQSIQIKADYDEEARKLQISLHTKNWDEKINPKTSRIPITERYSPINNAFTQAYVLFPDDAKIAKVEERAYTVPEHKWKELSPLDESPKANLIQRIGEVILSPGKLIDSITGYPQAQQKKRESEIKKQLNGGDLTMQLSQIEMYPIEDIISGTETAREITVYFDAREMKRKDFPVKVSLDLAVGNPSDEDYTQWKGVQFGNDIAKKTLRRNAIINPEKPLPKKPTAIPVIKTPIQTPKPQPTPKLEQDYLFQEVKRQMIEEQLPQFKDREGWKEKMPRLEIILNGEEAPTIKRDIQNLHQMFDDIGLKIKELAYDDAELKKAIKKYYTEEYVSPVYKITDAIQEEEHKQHGFCNKSIVPLKRLPAEEAIKLDRIVRKIRMSGDEENAELLQQMYPNQ